MKKVKLFEEFINEGLVGPFFFNDSMSDEDLKRMYDDALDGYANWLKGFEHPKSDYKKAYQEIEKILKKRGVKVDESLINEKSEYPVYHNLYSSAINAVEIYANSQGYQLDAEEYGNTYVDAFFKPNEGKTKKDTLSLYKNGKEQKKALHVQIYNRGADKFELNMYIN